MKTPDIQELRDALAALIRAAEPHLSVECVALAGARATLANSVSTVHGQQPAEFKAPVNVTIARPRGGDDTDCVSITMRCARSRFSGISVRIPLAQFARMLMSEVTEPVIGEVLNLGMFGATREESTEWVRCDARGRSDGRDEAAARLAAQRPGWLVRPNRSQGAWRTVDGAEECRMDLTRWVHKGSDPCPA